MDMKPEPTKSEPTIRYCAACHRRYAVRYEFGAPRDESPGSDRVHVRAVPCPSCRHANPLVLPMYVHHIEAESDPPRERRATLAQYLKVAAIQLMRPFRPFLP